MRSQRYLNALVYDIELCRNCREHYIAYALIDSGLGLLVYGIGLDAGELLEATLAQGMCLIEQTVLAEQVISIDTGDHELAHEER